MIVESNAALQPYNTFGIVAKARTLVRVRGADDLSTRLPSRESRQEQHDDAKGPANQAC